MTMNEKTIWMYFETDGDSGYYHIKLFSTKEKAEVYKLEEDNAYGRIGEVTINEGVKIKNTLEEVECPECSGPMVSRTGKYGVFWGCKKYPECRGTRDSMGRSRAEREAEKDTNEDIDRAQGRITNRDFSEPKNMYPFRKGS